MSEAEFCEPIMFERIVNREPLGQCAERLVYEYGDPSCSIEDVAALRADPVDPDEQTSDVGVVDKCHAEPTISHASASAVSAPPAPPYSTGTTSPIAPISPRALKLSAGNARSRSIRAASGGIRCSATSRMRSSRAPMSLLTTVVLSIEEVNTPLAPSGSSRSRSMPSHRVHLRPESDQ